MAVVRNNNLIDGISGLIGKDLLFKQINNKTFVFKRAKKPTKQSPQQKENRTKFKRASIFAKQMMEDPVMKAEYLEKAKSLHLPNAYTAAVTEYMRKPEIGELQFNESSEKSVETIRIHVKKKGFEVQIVEVVYLDNAGRVIEQGKAENKWGNEWSYSHKFPIDQHDVAYVLIRARERTGNFAEKKFYYKI